MDRFIKDLTENMNNEFSKSLNEVYLRGYMEGREDGYDKGYACATNKFKKLNTNFDTWYDKGLESAWECAKKICCVPSCGGYSFEELKEIFGYIFADDIMAKYSIKEVIAKILEYEMKKYIPRRVEETNGTR